MPTSDAEEALAGVGLDVEPRGLTLGQIEAAHEPPRRTPVIEPDARAGLAPKDSGAASPCGR